ncbi:MAG: putative sulfate exporter family transporter [Rhodobacterales bacterium]|nr:putative sulfate exporter family transporter [Rhodobacterales bacterium]
MIRPALGPAQLAAAAQGLRLLLPGIAVALTVAAASTFLSDHHGGPVMLFALLIGMSLHFLSRDAVCAPGLDFTSKRLLRWGIALLGARITLDQIASLGARPIVIVLVCLAATIGAGLLLARLTGRDWAFGVLTGGAVAICGASAALAISAVLPRAEGREQHTLFTVVAVTSLSTVAMILYPPVFAALGFAEAEIGILLGATIHDVAQVVGAGYAVSDLAGDTATYVKLLRVAMLPVVVVVLALIALRNRRQDGAPVPWPLFTLAFLAILLANSLGLLPPALAGLMLDVSRWLLVAAIAALGIKTSLQALFTLGPANPAIVLAETLFLALLATLLLTLL